MVLGIEGLPMVTFTGSITTAAWEEMGEQRLRQLSIAIQAARDQQTIFGHQISKLLRILDLDTRKQILESLAGFLVAGNLPAVRLDDSFDRKPVELFDLGSGEMAVVTDHFAVVVESVECDSGELWKGRSKFNRAMIAAPSHHSPVGTP